MGRAAGAAAPGGGGGAGALAAEGQQIFDDQGCSGCHTFAAAGATQTIGPDLDEVLPDRTPQEIEQSIVDPDAELSPGFNQGDHARQLRRRAEPGRARHPRPVPVPERRARAVAGNKIGEPMPVALKQPGQYRAFLGALIGGAFGLALVVVLREISGLPAFQTEPTATRR